MEVRESNYKSFVIFSWRGLLAVDRQREWWSQKRVYLFSPSKNWLWISELKWIFNIHDWWFCPQQRGCWHQKKGLFLFSFRFFLLALEVLMGCSWVKRTWFVSISYVRLFAENSTKIFNCYSLTPKEHGLA